MIDLDRFKQINDLYGHLKGDQSLIFVANILSEVCTGHQLFRFGGDEFCILFHLDNCHDAAALCRTLNERLKESENTLSIELSCSFGLALYSPGITAHELIQRADNALYQSKYEKCGICCYSNLKTSV